MSSENWPKLLDRRNMPAVKFGVVLRPHVPWFRPGLAEDRPKNIWFTPKSESQAIYAVAQDIDGLEWYQMFYDSRRGQNLFWTNSRFVEVYDSTQRDLADSHAKSK